MSKKRTYFVTVPLIALFGVALVYFIFTLVYRSAPKIIEDVSPSTSNEIILEEGSEIKIETEIEPEEEKDAEASSSM